MIPAPTDFCSRAGVGSSIASTCARPTNAPYAPARPSAATRASFGARWESSALALATATVPASARLDTLASPPVTSWRETSVTTVMCAVTTAAAGSAATALRVPEPMITSSPRQAAIDKDATGVDLPYRS